MIQLIDFDSYPVRETIRILLKDKATKQNIVWATNSYEDLGADYSENNPIEESLIRGINKWIVMPRVEKDLEQQLLRTRKKAEVFTPSWICNKMNNICDDEWFGKENIFNYENDKSWTTTKEKIEFTDKKTWKNYVDTRKLEITCGEAPYICSRYDMATGEIIPINNRIGFLDRKLRVVNENTTDKNEWYKWTIRAFQSTYGYEFQGDNLIIARINLLLSFYEYYIDKWNEEPSKKELKKIANIISWNIWQMDGLKGVVPNGSPNRVNHQFTFEELLFPETYIDKNYECKLYNWRLNNSISYSDLKGVKSKMKFDFVIGNPPYQISDGGGTGDSAKPIYHLFIEEAQKLKPRYISMIVPSRWMKGGKGLDEFRTNMINNTSLKYIFDFEKAEDCFAGVHIDGGVCFFLIDNEYEGKCIFTHQCADGYIDKSERFIKNEFSSKIIRDSRQISIIEKSHKYKEKTFNLIVSTRKPYGIATDLFNANEKYPESDLVYNKKDGYLKIYGVKGNKGGAKRLYGYVTPNFPSQNIDEIKLYKIFFSYAYTTTATVPPKPILGKPNEISTETFLRIGPFISEGIANNCMNYIFTKFFRALLFYNRAQKNASTKTFELIPLQDFTENSDIDWSKSIHEIDLQLYKKYGLDENEIEFIEKNVKEMS